MPSVTQRIDRVKQPYGGYIKPSSFRTTHITDSNALAPNENIHPSLIGMSVDYLTRYMLTQDNISSFDISLRGAAIAGRLPQALYLASKVNGLDNESVISACRLASFDVWYRSPFQANSPDSYEYISPDDATISNIRIMVNRCVSVLSAEGLPVTCSFTFEPDGYTRTVNAGDGDFLSERTMWDIKVIRSRLTSKHTLQLLMYWIMGRHSGQEQFMKVERLGVINPRLCEVYTLEVSRIPEAVISAVEREVICY